MNAKDYLLRIRKAVTMIEIRQREIEKLEEMLDIKAVTYDTERVQGGKPKDREELICKMLDYENELKTEISRLIDLKKETLEQINKLKDEDFIAILYKRYFEFKKWEEISIEMDYSYRWILKLHGKALQDFEKIIH